MVYCGYTPGSWNLLQITCDPTYQDALSLSLSIYIYIYIYRAPCVMPDRVPTLQPQVAREPHEIQNSRLCYKTLNPEPLSLNPKPLNPKP